MNHKINKILKDVEYIIPNLDIDGFFTSAILKKVKPSIKTVGFSNSHDIVYFFNELRGKFNKENTLYIDLYTKNCMCIDQHVVSYTTVYNEELKSNDNNLNPNVEFDRIGKSPNYYWKYPFSSAMWLIYCLNSQGIVIDFNYDKIVFEDITLSELFFHADSMLYNKIDKEHKYEKNINKWWEILLNGNDSNNVTELHKRYMALSDERIEYLHTRIGQIINFMFGCKPNGGYSKIENYLKDKINQFANFICDNLEVEHIIEDFAYKEIYEKRFYENKRVIIKDENEFNEIIKNENVFSFAFVFNNTINYSYS